MSLFEITEYLLWKSIKNLKGDSVHKISKHRTFENNTIILSHYKQNEETTANDTKMICRVCASTADISISDKISSEIGSMNIMTALRSVAYISVTRTDPYPKHVCQTCLDELKIAVKFKKKCENSDYKFRQSSSNADSGQVLQSNKVHDFQLILAQMQRRRELLETKIKFKTNETQPKSSPKFKDLSENNILHKCKQCDLQFDNKVLLTNHRLQRNCISPPCNLCGKLVSNLSRHKRIVHFRTNQYTCHICGKMSYSHSSLQSHLLVHSEEFSYSCSLCPYKGKRQIYLTLHMRTHTGEHPYLCSECPAKFVNSSNLRKHELVHANKKFECNKCKKKFRLQKTLQEHFEAAHLNVRYRCSICSVDLWSRRKLLRHELRVHKREKHKLFEGVHKVILNDEN